MNKKNENFEIDLLHQLLYTALLEIREEAHSIENRKIYMLSNFGSLTNPVI